MNKTEYNNAAVVIVLIAGILWSFGALVVRYIENAYLIPWQYIFFPAEYFFSYKKSPSLP